MHLLGKSAPAAPGQRVDIGTAEEIHSGPRVRSLLDEFVCLLTWRRITRKKTRAQRVSLHPYVKCPLCFRIVENLTPIKTYWIDCTPKPTKIKLTFHITGTPSKWSWLAVEFSVRMISRPLLLASLSRSRVWNVLAWNGSRSPATMIFPAFRRWMRVSRSSSSRSEYVGPRRS